MTGERLWAGGDAAGGHEPLTTKEGWRRFVDQPTDAVDLHDPTVVGHGELSESVTEVIEDARLAYHSRLAVVATPTVQQVTLGGRRLIVLNRHQLSARRDLIVTGPAGTGKTTAITQLGKAHELALRLRHPQGRLRMPVIYVTVPPAATARMLAVEFARFLGLPVTPRANITDVTNAVCAVLIDLRCDLVIVDLCRHRDYAEARARQRLLTLGIGVPRLGIVTGFRGTRGPCPVGGSGRAAPMRVWSGRGPSL